MPIKHIAPIERPEALSQLAGDRIIDLAAAGDLPIGEPVSTDYIASLLGISRTPVREALISQSSVGIVRMVRNIGTVINCPSQRDVANLMDVRHSVERGAMYKIRLRSPEIDLGRLGLMNPGSDIGEAADEILKSDSALHLGLLRAGGFHIFDRFAVVTGITRRLYHAVNPLTDLSQALIVESGRNIQEAVATHDIGVILTALDEDHRSQLAIVNASV